ncbi:MAG TPA: hypothetical protein DEQ09_07470 [Bacteroidales bacterium]|nr:hypothetical protein [Bacteroidales bacterium]
MVLKTFKTLTLFLIFSLCWLSACEDLYIVDCDNCLLIEPTTCLLNIELPSDRNLYDVTIYRGKLEDGLVLYEVSTYSPFVYEVGLNSEYTVTATVIINGKQYTAVDSTRPRVDVITDECDELCYWVVHKTVNLKIKYF